jgi:threonine dehydratase
MPEQITREAIAAAEKLIRPYIRRTPIIDVRGEDFGLDGISLVFKLEFMQHSGSFKARGAFANLLMRDIPKAGVAAASGGNHGAAVAYAAKTLGVPARIYVPEVCSPEKIDRIRGYGADLVVGGALYADALAACDSWLAQSGALSIHAYDATETMLGAGTAGLEFGEQAQGLDAVIVAVGGGGFISGTAAALAGGPKIVASEPELSPTLAYALKAGRPVAAPGGGIAADSMAPRSIGEKPFAVIRERVSEALLVTDDAILAAQKALWEKLRVVVEPGGAAAFAALLAKAYKPRQGERVGVILCGANTTAVKFDQ